MSAIDSAAVRLRAVKLSLGGIIFRIILRLTWKREVRRLQYRVEHLERLLETEERHSKIWLDCNDATLDELKRSQQLVRHLRKRVSELGRQVIGQRKPKLP